MQVKCLGYVGVFARDPEEWRDFATNLLGMQVQTTAAGLALRMDDRPHRLLVHTSDRDGAASQRQHVGWKLDVLECFRIHCCHYDFVVQAPA